MSYKVIMTEHAHDQLLDIARYIALSSQSCDVALGAMERIETALSRLTSVPHSGSYPRSVSLRRRGYRVLIVDKYLAFYKCNDERKTATVYHIVDSRTDYQTLI